MEIFLGSHLIIPCIIYYVTNKETLTLTLNHFLLIMKHTPPPLVLLASAVLSIRKTEKLLDGVTAVSGTEDVSHVSVKQRMLQSLMSR